MNVPQNSKRNSIFRAVLAAALLPELVITATALPKTEAAMSEAKNHVLFVGTDLAVRQDGKFYHVVGATKDTLKIEKDHGMADVRMGRGADVRITKGVKLSNLSATISHVETESVDRASAQAQLAAMQASSLLADQADMAADKLHGEMILASAVGVNSASGVRGADTSSAAVTAAQSQATDNYTGALPGLNLLSDSANTFLMHGVAEKGQTEVRLTFDVSSPEPLDHAYIVVVANYGNKDGALARQISARAFEHIDNHPQHVAMSHAASINGLPFKKFDLALFANGQEVATNLSEKRMPLTTDEAYNFFLIDYLSAHKGATLLPAPMLMAPRSEFRRQVETADTHQAIYVTVDKTGKVLSRSADKAGSEKLPASVDSALQNVRFMPALKDGVPVEGRIKVTLAQLAD